MRFDPERPVCDGILFSELYLIRTEDFQNALAARGVVYLTEFTSPEGAPYSGDIVAKSRRAAEGIAFSRGLGERVVGQITRVGVPQSWRKG